MEQSRIKHFKVQGEWNLHHYIESFLQLNIDEVNKLLDLGAIYLNKSRIKTNTQLHPGDYLRVHIEPRRFPHPENINSLVLFEDEDFIAINKPAGTPCHPTLDNSQENILNLLSLERNQQVYLCHRLDIGTSGVLLFAKTKAMQTYLMQNWQSVRKIYRAFCHGPLLPEQKLQHWMRPHPRAPKILACRPVDLWQVCELNILKTKSIKLAYEYGGAKAQVSEHEFNEYKIELLTGRTHQIRAQLSFENNPILGDSMYGSVFSLDADSEPFYKEHFALKCIEISFSILDKNYIFLASE